MTDLVLTPNEQAFAIQEERITIHAEVGDVHVRVVKPVGTTGFVPVVLYVHGEGRIRDDDDTQESLVRDFALGANTAVVFVGYSLSAPADRPVVIEQAYAAVRWVTVHGAANGLDASRLVIAGDRLDPNAGARGVLADGPRISGRAMAWFWAHYSPGMGGGEEPPSGRYLSRSRSAPLSVLGAPPSPASDS